MYNDEYFGVLQFTDLRIEQGPTLIMTILPEPIEYFHILGTKIHALTPEMTIEVIDHWISRGIRSHVVVTGAHGIIEMQSDATLRRINNSAGLITPDGMPAVWLGRLKGYRSTERVYGPTLMLKTLAMGVERGYRHFLYGGRPGVVDNLKGILTERYPGLNITGTFCPPFRELSKSEVNHISDMINKSEADIVWCGLGCPKQELWMDRFRPLLKAPVLIGVGAAFDFLSGEKKMAPAWMQRAGLEWFYRLLSDPKRLWKRYIKVVPKFIILNIAEMLHIYHPHGKD